MRIGVVYLGRRGPGGAISVQLAAGLAGQADLFAVVSRNADDLPKWRVSGIRLVEAATFGSTAGAFASLLNPAAISRLASRIRAEKPDVVLYPMVHPWTPFLQRCLKPIPHVVTVHDPIPHPGVLHRLSSFWERRAARRAARCVILSGRFIPDMERSGVPKGKIDVIPHPALSNYGTATHDVPANSAAAGLLFFGRIAPYKGLDVLLRAYRALAERRPGLKLKIAGEGRLRRYAPLLRGLPGLTVVNRWVADEEVAEFFGGGTIVVLPYRSASQSGVVAVAAAFACPVVAASVGAIPDQIEDGRSGLLVEPGSVGQLADAIDKLLKDPLYARRLGECLARRNREENNWEKTARAYAESCRKALKMGT